ncbi:hypothetical protein BTVI_49127 [Pitangus sulphuratus]|nr:hypothetical protein BTVI_49127 [Pitangus sulphuratus]
MLAELLQLVVGRDEKRMRKEVWRALVLLLFRVNDQVPSVAKASREALFNAAELLKGKTLMHLLQRERMWELGVCLLQKSRSRAEDFIHRSLPYLQNPQANVRLAAIRFIGEKIFQILLKASFAFKTSKVEGHAQGIQFLGVKWQDRRCHIPKEVINKITAMSPPTSKKEMQAFLGAIGFWRMHIPEYSHIVIPLYLLTCKKNDFQWGPE